ncbi:dihydroorotate dehydrogenase [Dialister succinatiphilus]|uniref:dihydroorotate dehydrogenase n=1 Tax=Dialister succinatiphilus TaxID=487173 RepID=UPI002353A4B6|nr:dihydroorotate dehydrogenase [Dialister succinatiphilus]MCI6031141.1 dihydroorotate dehydrogenase [Dialister succinatiphilus]
MSSLTVNYLGIPMASPVIGASGTVGYGLELHDYIDMKKIGALSGKGLAPTPWKGNEGVRVAETTSGMLNCIGLENPGAPYFIQHYLPEVRKLSTVFIANMVGKSVEEYAECARMLTVPGISALEVNISCPNVKEGGAAFGTDPAQAAAVTRAVKDATTLPVIVKLSPNVTDIVSIAKAVEDAGADSISLINTLLGIAIDTRTRRPILGNITGGLSGPAIKPVALRMVWQTAKAVKIPVCGLGGIMTGEDAIEFMMAGASTVQVGTANLADPTAMERIVNEMDEWCDKNNVKDINEIVGTLKD